MEWVHGDGFYALIARSYGLERADPRRTPIPALDGCLAPHGALDYLIVPGYSPATLAWLRGRDRTRTLRLYCSTEDVALFPRAPDEVFGVYRADGATPGGPSVAGVAFRTLAAADRPALDDLYASDAANPFLEAFDRATLLAAPHLAAFAGPRLVAVTGTVFSMRRELEVGRDFTHPEFRRRGIQRALVAEFIRRLRAAGEARVLLAWIRRENQAAQRLFSSLGFGCRGEFCSYTLAPTEIR